MFQSAYMQGHSPETVILRVQSDILTELDKGKTLGSKEVSY